MKTNLNANYAWDVQALNKKSGTQASGILEERSGLSVDDFLKIMAAEMQNQSPMGGSEGGGGSKTDYISQLAQFTSLEQMTDIVENLNYLNVMSQQQYAFSLIGKGVSLSVPKVNGTGAGDLETITGVVQKVKFKEGVPMITVGGKDYQLASIMEVGQVEEAGGSKDEL